MNEFISIMQDVAKLATGGSDIARAEARRIDAARERRAAEAAQDAALRPLATIAVRKTNRPVEGFMRLQSTFARAILLVASAGRLSF